MADREVKTKDSSKKIPKKIDAALARWVAPVPLSSFRTASKTFPHYRFVDIFNAIDKISSEGNGVHRIESENGEDLNNILHGKCPQHFSRIITKANRMAWPSGPEKEIFLPVDHFWGITGGSPEVNIIVRLRYNDYYSSLLLEVAAKDLEAGEAFMEAKDPASHGGRSQPAQARDDRAGIDPELMSRGHGRQGVEDIMCSGQRKGGDRVDGTVAKTETGFARPGYVYLVRSKICAPVQPEGYFSASEARWLSGWLERLATAALAPVPHCLRHGDTQSTNVIVEAGSLAYVAVSWGAGSRLGFSAVDDRFRAVVYIGGGIDERVGYGHGRVKRGSYDSLVGGWSCQGVIADPIGPIILLIWSIGGVAKVKNFFGIFVEHQSCKIFGIFNSSTQSHI